MKATFTNLSSHKRTHWAVVTLPQDLEGAGDSPEAVFRSVDGRVFRAVRGKATSKSVVYRVRLSLEGSETIQGTLLLSNATSPTFAPHAWVRDDLAEIIPQLGALPAGETEWQDMRWTTLSSPLSLVDSSAAHQRWHLQQRCQDLGLILEWWADVYHEDPVMSIWGKVVWSDRTDPANNRQFSAMALRAGELMVLDFGVRNGVNPSVEVDGKQVSLLFSGGLGLSDGSGLPFSGSMLAFSPSIDKPLPPDVLDSDVQNLLAASEGPILGVCHEWDRKWLAATNVPPLSVTNLSDEKRELDWSKFKDEQATSSGWFSRRAVGIQQSPGQTGNQEDFGASKGTYAVTCHDPRFIQVYQDSAQAELFRGFNHYESDGKKLRANNHPDWITWSGATHYSASQSPDRLGKSPNYGPPATGWRGYDDQHKSLNNFSAYATLSDDPLIADQLSHMAEIDAASFRVRRPNVWGQGAARAIGRVNQVWANFAKLPPALGASLSWEEMTNIRVGASLSLASLNVEGPMKVLDFGGPDGRKQVYLNGQLAQYASMWEHGLAAVGLRCSYNQNPTENVAEVLLIVCRTLATYGCLTDSSGGWWTVDDVAYDEGRDIPFYANSAAVEARPGVGGVGTWTQAGLLVAQDVLAESGSDQELVEKLDEYFFETSPTALGKEQAEWWAIKQQR